MLLLVPTDAFAVLAEPTRRRILDTLRRGDRSVGDLVDVLAVSLPTVSKHLRVLRETGFVSVRAAAQQRMYRIEPGRLRELDAWLAPYRALWEHHLDALEQLLDEEAR